MVKIKKMDPRLYDDGIKIQQRKSIYLLYNVVNIKLIELFKICYEYYRQKESGKSTFKFNLNYGYI